MKSINTFKSIVAAATLGWAFSASAGTVTISELTGTLQETGGLATHLVDANELVGMTVTVTFADASTETAIWADTGGTNGAASGFGGLWSVSGAGNALNAAIIANFSGQAITSFTIDGGAGDGVFDLGPAFVDAGQLRTPGTVAGYPFEVTGQAVGDNDVNVTYFDAVFLTGDPVANGDIYRQMTVDIVGGLAHGDIIEWRSDMDSLEISGDIGNVPAPAGILLLLAGLAGMRRRG